MFIAWLRRVGQSRTDYNSSRVESRWAVPPPSRSNIARTSRAPHTLSFNFFVFGVHGFRAAPRRFQRECYVVLVSSSESDSLLADSAAPIPRARGFRLPAGRARIRRLAAMGSNWKSPVRM